jgi:hypothetical protein
MCIWSGHFVFDSMSILDYYFVTFLRKLASLPSLSESRCDSMPPLRDSDNATYRRDAHSGATSCVPLPGHVL